MVKILMLGWELPPNNSGGLGVACLQICQALASRGADIEFILPYTTKENPHDFMTVTSTRPAGLNLINQVGIYDSYKYTLATGEEISISAHDQQEAYAEVVARIAEVREFDVIHAHDWLTFRAALRAKETSGKPLIVHVHSIEKDRAGGAQGNPLVREIEATGMLIADRVIAVSERTRQMIASEYAIPLEKIDVVHNSIDRSSVEALDPENAYTYLETMRRHGWRVVVNVGRLTIQKGLSHLLTSAAEVIKRSPKTFFLFVGSGEQRDELIAQAAGLGIADKVLFTGFQRGKRWRDAYAVADLFVLPSVSEPFGLTPLEAIGYGTPVLISRQSGVSEVLNNSLKVDYWDTNEMANKIYSVVANDSLRDSLQTNAYQEYETLSWDCSIDKLLDIYAQHQKVAQV
jgi:glycogen synthase